MRPGAVGPSVTCRELQSLRNSVEELEASAKKLEKNAKRLEVNSKILEQNAKELEVNSKMLEQNAKKLEKYAKYLEEDAKKQRQSAARLVAGILGLKDGYYPGRVFVPDLPTTPDGSEESPTSTSRNPAADGDGPARDYNPFECKPTPSVTVKLKPQPPSVPVELEPQPPSVPVDLEPSSPAGEPKRARVTRRATQTDSPAVRPKPVNTLPPRTPYSKADDRAIEEYVQVRGDMSPTSIVLWRTLVRDRVLSGRTAWGLHTRFKKLSAKKQ